MKIKLFAALLFLGLTSFSFAGNFYYPPERIRCKLDHFNKPFCVEFNRRYLIEDQTNANLSKTKDKLFHFFSAVAYTSPTETSIFVTYNDAEGKMLKLKTINTNIHADLRTGGWKRFNKDIYLCSAGYMICAITDLP